MEDRELITDEPNQKPIDDNQQNDNQIDNPIIPMNQQQNQADSDYLPEITTDRTYGFIKIFIIFIVQTIIQTVFCKLKFFKAGDKDTLIWTIIIFCVIATLVLLSIRGYDGKYDSDCCAIFVFILFCVFKIGFFMLIYYIVDYITVSHFYTVNVDDFDNKTDFGNFDFANLAIIVFYLALIIFTYCKRQANLLIYFIIGFSIALIMFLSLLSINVVFGAYTAALIFLEIAIFLLVAKIAISGNKLVENNVFNNILIIDFYKYAIIMIIALIILTILIYLIYFMCLLLGACCKGMTSHPSSVDEKGNVYDQYGDKLGHYSKKPKFFDSAGNVYDKHHNKIEPDCQIF